ncbi:uncharacterized protein V6R79_013467 [Siganus canaliculatus]
MGSQGKSLQVLNQENRELNAIDRPGPFKISASISISSPNTHAASFPSGHEAEMGLEQRELHLDTHRPFLLYEHRANNALKISFLTDVKFCCTAPLAGDACLHVTVSSLASYQSTASNDVTGQRCQALCVLRRQPCRDKSCYQCFIEPQDSGRLCSGHILTEYNIVNVDSCFKKLDRIFNHNEKVIEAARVGEGYDKQLKEILKAEILPLAEEFYQKLNKDTVYEERLQTAADNFIAAASKLPRDSGCIPPCGFQQKDALYNCITCKYDSCEFPLDCPVKEIKVTEKRSSQMWCEVPFHLPSDIEVIWRFADEVKTDQVDQFREVTAGDDRLYSISSAGLQHQGTYQCEIFSGQRSIVRLYYYLTVTPLVVAGHTELQETFDLSLLPGGQLLPSPGASTPSLLSPLLLAVCLTAVLLLLFLTLGPS